MPSEPTRRPRPHPPPVERRTGYEVDDLHRPHHRRASRRRRSRPGASSASRGRSTSVVDRRHACHASMIAEGSLLQWGDGDAPRRRHDVARRRLGERHGRRRRSPGEVFDFLRRPKNHALISGDESVRGNVSGPELLEPGSQFGMSMKVGVPYRISSKVVEFEQDRVIAWRHFGGHRWRWELEPVGARQTRVTETFDQSTAKVPFVLRAVGYPKRHLPNVANVRRQRRRPASPRPRPHDDVRRRHGCRTTSSPTSPTTPPSSGIAYDGPPLVRRAFVDVGRSRAADQRPRLGHVAAASSCCIHGGAQNAHTWDTVALALDRPLVAIDLPGHGHSDGAAAAGTVRIAPSRSPPTSARRSPRLAPDAAAVVGHVARRADGDRSRRAAVPSSSAVSCSSTSRPGVDRDQGQGDHRLRPRPGDVRQLRRHPCQDDRAQPDADRGRRCVAASCTTPNSSTTDRGAGATAVRRRHVRVRRPTTTSTRRRGCGMPSAGSPSR